MGNLAKRTSPSNGSRTHPLPAEERERLILVHLPLVQHIARHIRRSLPDSVSLDDLISTGVIGLISAIDRYDGSRNVKLAAYAKFRIRGAILDSLRRLDWAPRQSRKRARQIRVAVSTVERRLRRSAEEADIAGELGLTIDEYRHWSIALIGLKLESLEDANESRSHKVDSGELRVLLNVAISRLPENERRVLHLHCYEELGARQIAARLGLCESRINQLKSQAILRCCKQMITGSGRDGSC
jgi:RNA polymerase sigma factor for flagellar operon FliA